MLKGWILSGTLAVLWVVLQIAIFQIRNPVRKFRSMTLLFIPTVPLFIISYCATPNDLWFLPSSVSSTPFTLGLLNGIFVHSLMYGTHVIIFFAFSRSITLRILTEFRSARNYSMTLHDLQNLYSVERMIDGRLNAMVANKYLSVRNNRYTLSPSGRFFAGIFCWSRGIFPLKLL